MGRWLSNLIKGRSLELKESLNPQQLEELVINNSNAKGNIEIEFPRMAIISERLPLKELYTQLEDELHPKATLTTLHEVYAGITGTEKHYLDIQMQMGESVRNAQIIYETKSNV
jgi:hypothetical protein